eukprot:7317430-Pyramimonas_sp.AAC.1
MPPEGPATAVDIRGPAGPPPVVGEDLHRRMSRQLASEGQRVPPVVSEDLHRGAFNIRVDLPSSHHPHYHPWEGGQPRPVEGGDVPQ